MSKTNYISRIAIPATLAAIALSAAAAPAQLQLSELGKRHLPFDTDATLALALGDLDGDGDLDLVCGNGGQNRLYVNDGAGIFSDVTSAQMPIDSDSTIAVALGDVDGDGDLDLVCANSAQNRLYLNSGVGMFTDATAAQMPTDSDRTNAVALGDVDGDGDLDVLCANSGQNRLYLNDGAGTFGDETSGRLPPDANSTRTVALGDVDGDGACDLVCGNSPTVLYLFPFPPSCPTGFRGETQLYLNDGNGVFTTAAAAVFPTRISSPLALALADVDGDADSDVVFGNAPVVVRGSEVCGQISLAGQNTLYLNDGGTFRDATAASMPLEEDATVAVVPADVDGDGDLDLFLGNSPRNVGFPFSSSPSFVVDGGQNALYLNDGAGTFTDATAARLPASTDDTQAAVAGDVDGDGDVDLICGNSRQQNRLFLNDGTGRFTDATAARVPTEIDETQAIALADVDGDGDPDLVVGNGAGQQLGQNRMYLNAGNGTFIEAGAAAVPSSYDVTSAIALGDVDGDGDLDLVFGNHPYYTCYELCQPEEGQNTLYLNDGTGTFTDVTATRLPVDNDSTHDLALVDVDSDGDLDLVCGNSGQNRLYLNDGTGVFTDASVAQMPPDSDETYAVAFADVDLDDDPDLVCGNTSVFSEEGQQNRLYLNDGTGTFTDATVPRMPPARDGTYAIAFADVDLDGDPDLVCGNSICVYGSSEGQQNKLYLNDGTGAFTDATVLRMPLDSDGTYAVAFADVDLDGDPDLACGNWGICPWSSEGQQNRLYLNDGTGTFTDATVPRMLPDSDGTYAVLFADVDLDGDPDLVHGNRGQNRFHLNVLRQLDVPFLVRVGQRYQLDVYARYGPTGTVDTAVPFISTGTASLPVPPLGTFALDPAQMIRLPAFIIQQPEGLGSLSFLMPNLPGLVGASVYAQAVIVRYPAEHRLTNWTADVIMQ